MKKIILILGIILVSVLGFSQTKNINSAGSNLVKKDTDGNVVITGDVYLDATKKLILANDADDHTYIHESSADVYQEVVGGVVITQITETGDDLIELLNADVEIDSMLYANQITVTPATAVTGITINQDQNGKGLEVDSESSGEYAIMGNGTYVAQFTQDLTGGRGLRVQRNINEAGSNPLVSFVNDHASNTQNTLFIDHDGTGGNALKIDCESANDAIVVNAKYPAQLIQDISGGYGLWVARNVDEAGSSSLVFLKEDHTSGTQAVLELQNDGSGAHITTGATNEDLEIDPNGTGGVLVTGDLVTSTYNFAADAEASDTYVITLDPAPAALVTGMMFTFTANTANTDGATFNPNGFGAQAILKMHDQALATGDIEAGQVVVVVWDGANYQMLSQLAQ